MPIPKPKTGESENDYVARCIPVVSNSHPEMNQNQKVAICFTEYKRSTQKKSMKEKMSNFKEVCKK